MPARARRCAPGGPAAPEHQECAGSHDEREHGGEAQPPPVAIEATSPGQVDLEHPGVDAHGVEPWTRPSRRRPGRRGRRSRRTGSASGRPGPGGRPRHPEVGGDARGTCTGGWPGRCRPRPRRRHSRQRDAARALILGHQDGGHDGAEDQQAVAADPPGEGGEGGVGGSRVPATSPAGGRGGGRRTRSARRPPGRRRGWAAPAWWRRRCDPVTTRTSCSRNENNGWLLKAAWDRKTDHGGPVLTNMPTVWALSKSSDRPKPGR